ncbi:MAG TPA: SAM-dependent methyltransferase [Aldersonia sp.]
MYRDCPDPWGFAWRWYEQRKYALTVAALPRARFRRALEPGCSIGVLTALLARRCDEIVATDVVEDALAAARTRIAATPDAGRVECRTWAFGSAWGSLGRFDLIVLSEVAYYLHADALRAALETAVDHLEPGGTLVCVHWRHPAPDYPLTGDEVHRIVHATDVLSPLATYGDDDFRLDVFTRGPAISVATADGVLG